MDAKIRILAIDDQEIFRLGLKIGLRSFEDIELVAEAENGPEGLLLAEREQPDVAIIDSCLPGMDGVQVAERIPDVSPHTRLMLISGCFDDATIARAMAVGIDGMITKADSSTQFACFVRRVHKGIFSCSTSLLAQVLPNPDAIVTWH